MRRRPGKELKWRPLRSRTELSASVRKSRKKKKKKKSPGVSAAVPRRWREAESWIMIVIVL